MSASLEEVRTAMAAQMKDAIPGLHALPYVLTSPALPAAMVLRGEVDYDQAFEQGLHIWNLNVRCVVADLSDIGAPKLLDRFVDPGGDWSIKSALESDTTLGGLVQDLHVTGCDEERVFTREGFGGPLLGSEFSVTVFL